MMPQPVLDLGSNTPENLKRWSDVLKRGGDKLTVWNLIYSTKRHRWTAQEIADALKGEVSYKRVLTVCKQLVRAYLLHQIPGAFPIVYEKIGEVHGLKQKILAGAKSKKVRDSIPTKQQPKVKVTVRAAASTRRAGRAVELTIDDIDQFSRVRRLRGKLGPLKALPEDQFKRGLQRLFKDSGVYKDWGGERDDFYTNKLKIKGKRYSAAFALKGPGVGVKIMVPGKWGKRGNQIQRMSSVPAKVFVLQFEGQIDEDSVEQLKKFTELTAHQEGSTLYYGYIDRDDSLRLRRAYPNAF